LFDKLTSEQLEPVGSVYGLYRPGKFCCDFNGFVPDFVAVTRDNPAPDKSRLRKRAIRSEVNPCHDGNFIDKRPFSAKPVSEAALDDPGKIVINPSDDLCDEVSMRGCCHTQTALSIARQAETRCCGLAASIALLKR
jgi:hypothetical protein